MSLQPELNLEEVSDFERALQEQWRKNEIAYREGEGSEIHRCLSWMFQCDGRNWRDWFDAEPEYKRNFYLNVYRTERMEADAWRRPMRSFECCESILREQVQEEDALIDRWVQEIRAAAVERRPVPLAESEEMSGWERHIFRQRLAVAFLRAGVVIIEAPKN